jgi:hypothetical protein
MKRIIRATAKTIKDKPYLIVEDDEKIEGEEEKCPYCGGSGLTLNTQNACCFCYGTGDRFWGYPLPERGRA